MLKKILMITFIVCLAQCEGMEWTNWNTYAKNNPLIIKGTPTPPLPPNYSRYKDNTQNQNSYAQRVNHYRYIFTHPNYQLTTSAYCGPRSFLTTFNPPTNNIICKRDNSTIFWGAYPTFGQYCIPDVDKNPVSSMIIPELGKFGICKSSNYARTIYANFPCCFDDNEAFPSNFDLLKKTVSTSLYDLRNFE